MIEAEHPRRVFLAGGSGLLGQRLIPLLVRGGHQVAAMTRTDSKRSMLSDLGAEPIVCNAFDREQLIEVVGNFAPSVVINSLTDLPDHPALMADANNGLQHHRTLAEGTNNLIAAAAHARTRTLISQSVAWDAPGYAELERQTLEAGGIVLRFGLWYGDGTWTGERLPPAPRTHIDDAAARTAGALGLEPGIHTYIDES